MITTIRNMREVETMVLDGKLGCIGIDLGGPIISRPLPIGSWVEDPTACPWIDGVQDMLRYMVSRGVDVWIISRVRNGTVMDTKVKWLDHHAKGEFAWMRSKTIFCLERSDKIPIIQRMGIELFVDDREEICEQIDRTSCISVLYIEPFVSFRLQ